MKNIITLILIMIIMTASNAQDGAVKSDLRIKVDSIIEYQLKYQIIDTTLIQGKSSNCLDGNAKSRPIIFSRSSLPSNPTPLIVLDFQAVELEELNNYQLKNISELNVYNKNDNIEAIYGSRAINGLIIITTKKKTRRKRKKH